MNIYKILDNIVYHIDKHSIPIFKIGFVGNGEPLLNYEDLKSYILYIDPYIRSGKISVYTITNGILIDTAKLEFFKEHNVNVGFSLDGIKPIHNKWRCNSFDSVMQAIELYHIINSIYPPLNCTVGRDTLENIRETVEFFSKFNSKITFSRMIGKHGISLEEYRSFIAQAEKSLNVRKGGYDCTMYGGKCGAGLDNIFYSCGRVYLCGNCVDLETPYFSDTPIDAINFSLENFDRNFCYKERGVKNEVRSVRFAM
jgi:uncharacterized protein